MHGFATNREVNVHNGDVLINFMKKEKRFIVHCEAVNNNKSAKSMDSKHFRGLVNELYVCIGCEVTLTYNLNTEAGLYNSSKGKVVEIVFQEGKTINTDLPDYIMVKFDNFKGEPFDARGAVPIFPKEEFSEDYKFQRKQFPLVVNYAKTIDKL